MLCTFSLLLYWAFHAAVVSAGSLSLTGMSYISLGANLDYRGVATPFTIEAYFKIASPVTTTQAILSKWHGGSCAGWHLTLTSSNLLAWTESMFPPNTGIAPGQWYHVAIALPQGATGKSYLNGVNIGAASQPWNACDGNQLMIGAEYDNGMVSNFFIGLIDDVRIWTRELSAGEIMQATSSNYGPANVLNLIGFYSFQDMLNLAADSSPANHPGTIGGSPSQSIESYSIISAVGATVGDPIVIGFDGRSFEFNGQPGQTYIWFTCPAFQVNVHLERPAGNRSGIFITGVQVAYGHRGTFLATATSANLNPAMVPDWAKAVPSASPKAPSTLRVSGHCTRVYLASKSKYIIDTACGRASIIIEVRRHVKHGQASFSYLNLRVRLVQGDLTSPTAAAPGFLGGSIGGVLGRTFQSNSSDRLGPDPSEQPEYYLEQGSKSPATLFHRHTFEAASKEECERALRAPLQV